MHTEFKWADASSAATPRGWLYMTAGHPKREGSLVSKAVGYYVETSGDPLWMQVGEETVFADAYIGFDAPGGTSSHRLGHANFSTVEDAKADAKAWVEATVRAALPRLYPSRGYEE